MNKNKGQLPKLWKGCSVLQCSSISTNTKLFANCTFVLYGQMFEMQLLCELHIAHTWLRCKKFSFTWDMSKGPFYYGVPNAMRIYWKNKKFDENMNANEKNVELNELQMNRDIRDRKMTMTWFGSGVCTYTWNNVKSTKICECATKMVVLFKNYVLLNCITIKWSARCFVIYIRVQLMLTLKYIYI